MRHVSTFPRAVREIMTAWIPMVDGCRLAARIWLPVDADADPVPAVLEYLPYRRRDGTAYRDAITQPYLAGHGYAAVRVDIRGTGDSDGVIRDEYDTPELADGVAVIAWLAAQPWCIGAVGMWGISWGGFNALQVAALRPPALKAIIPIGFGHDRYDGDCHFMGGCLLEGNISWGTTFLAGSARPPDPAVVGAGWRAQWRDRLDAIEPPTATWLRHQRRDAYWKPGSVCEDYARIAAAVYAVSGWNDSYSRNVLPLLAGLTAPRKALVGPWAHAWPHIASPGPAIGFLQEAIRWWDHWLKGRDTGIMDEPMLRVWMGEWTTPRKWLPEAPGRWVQEPAWPRHRERLMRLHLGDAGLSARISDAAADVPVASVQTLGLRAGYQCSYGAGPDLSDDQRDDDALSACFDGAVLDAPVEVLGAPYVDLELTSDAPQAMLAARLCEVAPDGASLRVSYGLLNLSHRNGSAAPQPMVPGERTKLRVPLCAVAHRFAAGHRIRLALSTCYWPIAWPSPSAARIVLHTAACTLALPLHEPCDAAPPAFGAPEGANPSAVVPTGARRPDMPQDRIAVDPRTGAALVSRDRDRGAWHARDADVTTDSTGTLEFLMAPDDPLSARQSFTLTTTLGRAGWRTRTAAGAVLTATATHFVLDSRLEAFEGDARIFERLWSQRFPRDHV